MDKYNELLLYIQNENIEVSHLVTILELVTSKLEIDTISGMARNEGKSPNGIAKSSRYRKIKIGCQTMAVKGLRNVDLPF